MIMSTFAGIYDLGDYGADDRIHTNAARLTHCLGRRQVRVRMRVQCCLHTPLFAAAGRHVRTPDLQAISARFSAPRPAWLDFYPKVAGSRPARPIERKTWKCRRGDHVSPAA